MSSSRELDIFLETMGIGVSLVRGGKNNMHIPVIKNEKGESKRAEIFNVSIVQSGVRIYLEHNILLVSNTYFWKKLRFVCVHVMYLKPVSHFPFLPLGK